MATKKKNGSVATMRHMTAYLKRVRAAAPDGFEVTEGVGWMASFGHLEHAPHKKSKERWMRLKSDDVDLIFNATLIGKDGSAFCDEKAKVDVSGHTCYKAGASWWSKSRRGIDDSFYTTDLTDPTEVVGEQIALIEKSREHTAALVSVPGLNGITIHPKRKREVEELLRRGKTASLTPAGFGTGYQLSTRGRSPWGSIAPAETRRFFNVGTLYVQTFDYD